MINMNKLAKGWLDVKVADLFSVVGGGTPSTKDEKNWNGSIPWITSADIDENHHIAPRKYITEEAIESSATNKVLKNSIIIVTRVGLGKVGLAEYDLCFSQDCQGLIFNPTFIKPKFAMYQFSVSASRFQSVSRGTTISGITKKQLFDTTFYLAPRTEQLRIVQKIEEMFSCLDVGVAALERAKANLKLYRASVLKSAVEGKLTEEWRAKNPPSEPASKLLERILAKRRLKWEEEQLAKCAEKGQMPPKGWKNKYKEPVMLDATNLPSLPKGWCWVSLAQVSLFQNGRSFPSNEYSSQGVKLLRPGNLFEDGTVQWNEKNTRYMPSRWADDYPDYIVRGNELIMNLTAQSLKDEFLGRICLTDIHEYCLLNQRLARITPISGFNISYALYLLKSPIFRKFVNNFNTGSLIQHMFTSQLDQFLFPLPPFVEQIEISNRVEEQLSIISSISNSIEKNLLRASVFRGSLLKRAFEGKLVPQDPNDEPASVLLERIKAEREANVTQKPKRQPRKKAANA